MAAAVLFGASSCVKEDISSSLAGGEVEVTFTANLADLGTRAIGEADHIDVVYLGVYEKNSNTPLSNLVEADGYRVNNGVATFSVVLLKDKYYDLVFWAQKKDLDCYSIDWANRELTVDYQTVNAQDETRDAFFLVQNGFHAGHDETVFHLHRPFAQLNAGLSAEDVTNIGNNGVVVEDLYSAVVVENVANTLDLGYTTPGAVSGATPVGFASAAKPTQALTVNGVEYNYLSMNYLLVNEKQNVNITYSFVENGAGEEPYVRPYYNVPVQRNYRTNIIGNLISSPMDFTVYIDANFNAEYGVENEVVSATVKNVEQLTAALADEDVDVIVLAQNINLNEESTRAAITSITVAAGKTLTIDLNGYTLSGVESATTSFGLINNKGNLTINDSKGNGAIKLTATENRGWNAYSSVISNQPGGVLVVNGGTIEHLGGTDMAYGIDILTNGKGTSSVATINGGHIKSTYRAVRQFLNGIEANNSLTVNGGVIEGTNKSIWMQDPSKNANTGSLVVKAEAQLVGDVYLFVTAGSTEWPVSVNIAKAALVAPSTVISGNVPAGYYVVETEDCFAVATGAGVLVKNAEELAAALAEGATEVTLAGTFDSIVAKSGVSYYGTAYATVGYVNLNGAENVTLKNINFDAANAVMSYDGSGKTKQYANIMNDDNGGSNTPNRGASNIVIDGCTFTGEFANGGASIAFTDQSRSGGGSGNITIKNCTFNTEGAYYDIYGHYCGNGRNGKGDFIIENNTFKTKFPQGLPVYLGRYASSTPVVVKGNAFETVGSLDVAVYVQDHSNYGVSVNAENNTFAQ